MDLPLEPDQIPLEKVLEVLLVDSDCAALDHFKNMILKGCGGKANIELARSAEEAAAKLGSGTIDICLADYRLGSLTNFDFITKTGAENPKTAFVLLADESRKEWIYSALHHGAQDCVRKDLLDHFGMLKTIAFSLFHKSREQELRSAALRDSLTGLGNRSLFNEQAQIMIEQARRNREQLAILFMYIDGLKPVNDTLGHMVGDELIKQVSRRISDVTRKSDVLARMGGDEFAAILPRIQSPRTVAKVMESLVGAVEAEPYSIDGHLVRVGLSCGAAIFPDEAETVEELMVVSDTRMYAAKARKRARKPASAPSQASQGVSWLAKD